VRRGLAVLLASLAFAPAAHGGGPTLVLGAAEDAVKHTDLVTTKAQLTLLQLAGLEAVRVTSIWAPGRVGPDAEELTELGNVIDAASLTGVRVFVSVYHFGSRTTPLTDEARAEFSAYTASIVRRFPSVRDVIVGNEPNLNRFWLPQFAPDGSNAAAPAYLELLADTYDAVKEVSQAVRVIGGSLAPRGVDRPGTGRDTHSPTKFIRDLGTAYRASGRTLPIMDAFAIHPYGDTSRQPPTVRHPTSTTIGVADYDKLVRLLGRAFDGTAQEGSELPIVYDEYGVETVIPAAKRRLYAGTEPATIRPVGEATQAAYYRQAIAMAFCQPNVETLLLFHTIDEPARAAWQSGLHYADGAPKASRAAVAAAAKEARRGVVTACAGMSLTPRARLAGRAPRFRLTCSVDCVWSAHVRRRGARALTLVATGSAIGGVRAPITVPRLRRGRYQLVVWAAAPLNGGPAARIVSRPFSR
jgi:hypothetical protein